MPYRKILIAVDNSEFSMNAAKQGISLGTAIGADVALVYVIEEAKAVSNPDAGFGMSDTLLVLQKEAEDTMASIVKLAGGPIVTTLMPTGDPRTDILSCATTIGADLIVMGTHGRTGLKHMIMGSVAEYVVRHSAIPVLVVPTK